MHRREPEAPPPRPCQSAGSPPPSPSEPPGPTRAAGDAPGQTHSGAGGPPAGFWPLSLRSSEPAARCCFSGDSHARDRFIARRRGGGVVGGRQTARGYRSTQPTPEPTPPPTPRAPSSRAGSPSPKRSLGTAGGAESSLSPIDGQKSHCLRNAADPFPGYRGEAPERNRLLARPNWRHRETATPTTPSEPWHELLVYLQPHGGPQSAVGDAVDLAAAPSARPSAISSARVDLATSGGHGETRRPGTNAAGTPSFAFRTGPSGTFPTFSGFFGPFREFPTLSEPSDPLGNRSTHRRTCASANVRARALPSLPGRPRRRSRGRTCSDPYRSPPAKQTWRPRPGRPGGRRKLRGDQAAAGGRGDTKRPRDDRETRRRGDAVDLATSGGHGETWRPQEGTRTPGGRRRTRGDVAATGGTR